jgi:transcriptional regulator with XRE-family HTH domain
MSAHTASSQPSTGVQLVSRYYKPQMGRGHTKDAKGRVLSNDIVKRLQLELGAYLKELREATGMTQKQVSQIVGTTDNHISDIENGIRKISPERYEQFAKVYGVDRVEFGKRILLHYDPFTYKLLFGGRKVDAILSAIPERISEAVAQAD